MVFQKAFKIEIKLINLTPREPHKFDELLTFFSGEEFEAKEAWVPCFVEPRLIVNRYIHGKPDIS